MEVREASAIYAVLAGPQVPEGYKQTEVGVIPEDWGFDYIENLAHITTGSRNTQDRVDDGQYPFFVRSQTVEHINSYSFDGEAVLTAGDGVGTGKVFHYIKGKFDAHQRVYRISDFNERVNGYFFYLYFSSHFYDRIMQMTAKSSVDSVRREMIARMLIPLPPTKAEQEAIAEVLSDADALIESLERLLAKKRHLKQGAMQQLLTGKKRLPGFSGAWEVKPLGDLFNFSGGFSASRDQLSTDGYCYLHYGDIHTSRKNFVNVRSEYQNIPKLDIPLKKVSTASLLDDGDVVFVDASEDDEGTSKHVVIVNPDKTPFISGLHTLVAKSRTNELDHQYRRYCFQTPAVKAQFRFFAVGTKVSGISKTNIAKVTLPVPTVPEQTAIATILSDMDAEFAALEEKLSKARAIKQGMMQELLTGRIRLVHPESNVMPFPEKAQLAPTSTASRNKQINEAVIIGVLSKHFGTENHPLPRKRRVKLTYLLHRYTAGKAEGYLKKAAGPYDPGTKYKGPETIALKNGYVREHHNGSYPGFVAGDKIVQAERYFEKWYGTDVLAWLEQFKYKKTDELELLATVDMTMVDLAGEGRTIDLLSVKAVIAGHPEWAPKLLREIFSDANIASAIEACRELFA